MWKVLVQNLPCKVLEKEDFPSVIDILSFYVAKEDKLGETCERKLGVVKTTLSFYRKKATGKKNKKASYHRATLSELEILNNYRPRV